MPSPEELQAKRDELAALQKSNVEVQEKKDDEAAEKRRQEEYDSIEREIAFAKQAAEILNAPPASESSDGEENTPPDNSTVSNDPPSSEDSGETPAVTPDPPTSPSEVDLSGSDENQEGE